VTNPRQFAVVEIHWRPLPATLKYPDAKSFATTGYRETDGVSGIFSVYVRALDGEPGAGKVQIARLYALADEMVSRLPEVGMKFCLSTGNTVVAECVTTDRGEDENG
jgi:hypothetical protein